MTLTAVHKVTGTRIVMAPDQDLRADYSEWDQLICPISQMPVIPIRAHARKHGSINVRAHFALKGNKEEHLWPEDTEFDVEYGQVRNERRMVLTVMASVAEFESRRISERTIEAMAVAKTKGSTFGGRRDAAVAASKARKGAAVERAEALRGVLAPMAASGQSLRQMADALNAAGHKTERGSAWSHKTVGRVIERLELKAG